MEEERREGGFDEKRREGVGGRGWRREGVGGYEWWSVGWGQPAAANQKFKIITNTYSLLPPPLIDYAALLHRCSV